MAKLTRKMERFEINKLIPLDSPIPWRLREFTDWYKLFGNLNQHNQTAPPEVENVDGKLYLANGNQRAVWYAINGYNTMLAEQRTLNPDPRIHRDLIERRRKRALELQQIGIFSPLDWLSRIQNPEQYKVKT